MARVKHRCLVAGGREIDSRQIGEWVMEELQQLDAQYTNQIVEGLLEMAKKIAEKMGISESTSRSQYTRAKRALQKLLSKQKIF